MSHGQVSCGQLAVRLLADYGAEVVFGIPGVHTLEYYREFASGRPRHVLARHELGAAFMADGYARATGRVGVCCVITGPGVTNAATGIAQAYSDSVPVLVLASCNRRESLGRGWGDLHETRDQAAIVTPFTGAALSADAPGQIAPAIQAAYRAVSAARPRPAFVQVPIDVLAAPASVVPACAAPPARETPAPAPEQVEAVLRRLAAARRPAAVVGGGCAAGAGSVAAMIRRLGVPAITTIAGKGVVPASDPLHAGTALSTPAGRSWLGSHDLVLAIGTELAASDTLTDRLDLPGPLIRVDADPRPWPYAGTEYVRADAGRFAEAACAAADQDGYQPGTREAIADASRLRSALAQPGDAGEEQRRAVIAVLRRHLPESTRVYTDMTQLSYTGNVHFPVESPRLWIHPAGYGTLGYALPAAIGGAIGDPGSPVAAIAGDGGLLYTVQEMATAAELGLPILLLVWNNEALGQIRDDMLASGIAPAGVTPRPPDLRALASAFGWASARPRDLGELAALLRLEVTTPTLVELHAPTLFGPGSPAPQAPGNASRKGTNP
jgi:5-guanidino-2-oxopentanoate decarboxylase